jgi:hypothetical protein
MKLRLIFAVGLCIAAALSCEGMRRHSAANRIKIDEHSILIPGNAIAGEDQEAVRKIFKKYDGALYRIAVYDNGQLKKHLGKMSEMQMGTIASEYSANAKASGLSNWTMQIGFVTHMAGNPTHMTGNPTHVSGNPTHMTDTGNPTHVSGNPTHMTDTGNPTHAGRPTHHEAVTHPGGPEDSDALVKEVTPILEKYSK